MERLRIFSAAAALGTFTVRQLCAYSGAKADTVRSYLGRYPDVFTEVGTEVKGPGRPAKQWTVADPDRISADIREHERALAPGRPLSDPKRSEEDRLASIIVAEDALLRAWDEDESEDREMLAKTALRSLADLVDGPEDPLTLRARSVQVFAQISYDEVRGGQIGSEHLEKAAQALVTIADLAHERLFGFLDGLTAITSLAHAAPPLSIVTPGEHVTPDEAIRGLDGRGWVWQAVPGNQGCEWAQPWAEPLVARRLTGLVLYCAEDTEAPADWEQLFVTFRRVTPTVVLCGAESINVNRISRQGAYPLTDAGLEDVMATITSDLRRRSEAETVETSLELSAVVAKAGPSSPALAL